MQPGTDPARAPAVQASSTSLLSAFAHPEGPKSMPRRDQGAEPQVWTGRPPRGQLSDIRVIPEHATCAVSRCVGLHSRRAISRLSGHTAPHHTTPSSGKPRLPPSKVEIRALHVDVLLMSAPSLQGDAMADVSRGCSDFFRRGYRCAAQGWSSSGKHVRWRVGARNDAARLPSRCLAGDVGTHVQ